MSYSSVESFFSSYDKNIDLIDGHPVRGPIQYNITGEGGGNWYLEINGNDVIVHQGTIENPISIVECDASAYLDLKNDKLTHNEILKDGRMKLTKGILNSVKLGEYLI